MITTILLLIILSISFFLIMFRLYSISILLGAITVFIIGSLVLFQEGHILIGSVFLIVYSGAILVFICISLLISPAIRVESKKVYQKIEENIKYKYLMILFFILIYILVFFNYLIFHNSELTYAFNFQNFNLNNSNLASNIFIVDFQYIQNLESISMNSIEISSFCQYILKSNNNYEILNLDYNPINGIHYISQFNFNNEISYMYQDDIFLIIITGIYLFIVLLCCLVLFSINHEKRVIKRQDSVDQILKRWL